MDTSSNEITNAILKPSNRKNNRRMAGKGRNKNTLPKSSKPSENTENIFKISHIDENGDNSLSYSQSEPEKLSTVCEDARDDVMSLEEREKGKERGKMDRGDTYQNLEQTDPNLNKFIVASNTYPTDEVNYSMLTGNRGEILESASLTNSPGKRLREKSNSFNEDPLSPTPPKRTNDEADEENALIEEVCVVPDNQTNNINDYSTFKPNFCYTSTKVDLNIIQDSPSLKHRINNYETNTRLISEEKEDFDGQHQRERSQSHLAAIKSKLSTALPHINDRNHDNMKDFEKFKLLPPPPKVLIEKVEAEEEEEKPVEQPETIVETEALAEEVYTLSPGRAGTIKKRDDTARYSREEEFQEIHEFQNSPSKSISSGNTYTEVTKHLDGVNPDETLTDDIWKKINTADSNTDLLKDNDAQHNDHNTLEEENTSTFEEEQDFTANQLPHQEYVGRHDPHLGGPYELEDVPISREEIVNVTCDGDLFTDEDFLEPLQEEKSRREAVNPSNANKPPVPERVSRKRSGSSVSTTNSYVEASSLPITQREEIIQSTLGPNTIQALQATQGPGNYIGISPIPTKNTKDHADFDQISMASRTSSVCSHRSTCSTSITKKKISIYEGSKGDGTPSRVKELKAFNTSSYSCAVRRPSEREEDWCFGVKDDSGKDMRFI